MPMELHITVRILGSSGGLYTVRAEADDPTGLVREGDVLRLNARGAFRHKGESPLVGDFATVRLTAVADGTAIDPERGFFMEELLPRKNELIRPPMANLDYLLITAAAAHPDPALIALDKLTAACEARHVTPVIIINKCDLAPDVAERLRALYRAVKYPVFLVSALEGAGAEELRAALAELLPGRTAAFAGASGVGKSSCMNMLFPALGLVTGSVSAHNGRGRHTTRAVNLLSLPLPGGKECFLADTPGFGILDFENFDFMDEDDLIWAFPEFEPYITRCKYTKCTHTKEEGCAILRAVEDGKIARSRVESYAEMRAELRAKRWK